MSAHFGLDIGSTSIKLLELKSNKSVEAVGIAVNPVGSSNVELDLAIKAKLVDSVKSLVSESGVKSRNVVLSIPESLVFSRILLMPVMSTPELDSAIRWELDQMVPFPPEKIELSWVILDKPKKKIGNEKMKVFVVAVPNNVSQAYVRFLSLTGLEPLRIENEILSLARGVVDFGLNEGVSLVMDVGASTTKMVVAGKDQLYIGHVIPLAGMAMTRMISETFKIPFGQAEEYKRVYGVDKTQVEGKIFACLEDLINNLVLEIRKVMGNFVNIEKKKIIDRIILVGGGAYLRGFSSLLVQRTGLSVVLGDSFASFKAPEKVRKSGVLFATALGLAVSD